MSDLRYTLIIGWSAEGVDQALDSIPSADHGFTKDYRHGFELKAIHRKTQMF